MTRKRKVRNKLLPVTRATIVKLQKRISSLERRLSDQIEAHTLTNLESATSPAADAD
jgi:hypothetical protein